MRCFGIHVPFGLRVIIRDPQARNPLIKPKGFLRSQPTPPQRRKFSYSPWNRLLNTARSTAGIQMHRDETEKSKLPSSHPSTALPLHPFQARGRMPPAAPVLGYFIPEALFADREDHGTDLSRRPCQGLRAIRRGKLRGPARDPISEHSKERPYSLRSVSGHKQSSQRNKKAECADNQQSTQKPNRQASRNTELRGLQTRSIRPSPLPLH